jgi:hypothetical protein
MCLSFYTFGIAAVWLAHAIGIPDGWSVCAGALVALTSFGPIMRLLLRALVRSLSSVRQPGQSSRADSQAS